MSFVLDNSVATAWSVHDEQAPLVMELHDRVTETGATAPTLWPLDALNDLKGAWRRRRITRNQREQMAGFLRDLPVRLDGGAADRAWTSLAELADRFRLSLYEVALTRAAQAVSIEVRSH